METKYEIRWVNQYEVTLGLLPYSSIVCGKSWAISRGRNTKALIRIKKALDGISRRSSSVLWPVIKSNTHPPLTAGATAPGDRTWTTHRNHHGTWPSKDCSQRPGKRQTTPPCLPACIPRPDLFSFMSTSPGAVTSGCRNSFGALSALACMSQGATAIQRSSLVYPSWKQPGNGQPNSHLLLAHHAIRWEYIISPINLINLKWIWIITYISTEHLAKASFWVLDRRQQLVSCVH